MDNGLCLILLYKIKQLLTADLQLIVVAFEVDAFVILPVLDI